MKKTTAILSAALSMPALAASTAESQLLKIKPTAPSIQMTPDITYSLTHNSMGRTIQLSMDILKPSSRTPLPAVVFITGGGFMGAPKSKFISQRVDIARAGYVVASIDYRVVPMVEFPGNVQDAKTAVRFLRANAKKFGIDPNRIAVMGESAGGYLSAMVGASNGVKKFDTDEYANQSSDVQAAIDLYGLSDLTKVGDDFSSKVQEAHKSASAPEAMLLNGVAPNAGGSIINSPEKAKEANPMTYISNKTAPFLLMHGNADQVVSPSQTKILHEALIAHGIDSTRYVVDSADHAGMMWYQPEITNIIIQFLNTHLKTK